MVHALAINRAAAENESRYLELAPREVFDLGEGLNTDTTTGKMQRDVNEWLEDWDK